MNRLCDIAINCEDTTDPVAGLSSQAVSPAAGRCLGLDCPGDLFGNLSVECGDVDYLADTFRCFCVGDPIDIRFRAPGIGPFTWTVGDLPDGIVALPDFYCPEVLHIFGTFTVPGRDEVPISVKDGFGNITTITLTLCVLLIVTTTMPTPVVGVPYSLQLLAVGGSGVYAWKVLSGALAPGLTMTMSGLISGTPTAAQPSVVKFRVIDYECETPDATYSPPYCDVTGLATTETRMWLGFDEFIPSYPPKRYKAVSWSGTVSGMGIGLYHKGLFIDLGYCGTTTINAAGQPTGGRQETGYSGCHADVYGNCLSPGGTPVTISGCLSGPVVAGTLYSATYNASATTNWGVNYAANGIRDSVWGVYAEAGYSTILSSVQAEKKGTFFTGVSFTTVDRTVTLSDEYTDAEAASNASVATAPGLVAAYTPRTTGFVESRTTVVFTVHCHNLNIGQDYDATVTLLHSDGSTELRTYNFTAAAVDHDVSDTIALPAAFEWVAATLPTVSIA